MKGYIKGLVTGLLIGAAVTAIPAVAENIDALFNEVRININGIDRVQWGESITLDDGTQTPYSILYNGTTYLPLRKTAELLGKEVYWNGDSKTVSVVDKGSKETVAEKPDKNGNVWKYSTVETADGDHYLLLEDSSRGYERVYKLASKSIRVTDDEIYFFKHIGPGYPYQSLQDVELMKLSFNSDENSQDGIKIYRLSDGAYLFDAVFDGDYVYCLAYRPGTAQRSQIISYNYISGEEVIKDGISGEEYSNIVLEESDESKAVFSYDYITSTNPGTLTGIGRVTFDKIVNDFVTSATIGRMSK